jgi:hypothetical protein
LEGRAKEEDAEANRQEAGQTKRGPKRKHPLGKPKPTEQDNITDPDSRIMNTGKDGFQQCYNARIAVNAKAQITVAADVGDNAADNPALLGVLDQARGGASRPLW